MNETAELREAFDFLNLEDVDSKEVDELVAKLNESGQDTEKEAQISPDSKLSARSWALAYAHLDAENNRLKEYQKYLEERYIKPVKDNVERNEKAQDIIKGGIKQFLDNAEEDSVKFPDVGTFAKYSPPDSIVYPEDEESFAKEIAETGSAEEKSLIRAKFCLDKKAIKAAYKETSKLPLKGLGIETNDKSVRFTEAKPKKNGNEM